MWHCSPHGPTTIDKFFTFYFFVFCFGFSVFFFLFYFVFFGGVVGSYLRAFPIFGGVQLKLPLQFTNASSDIIVNYYLVK